MARPSCALIASSTMELKTSGRLPSDAATSAIRRSTSSILSGVSTNGIVLRWKLMPSNCDSRLLPSISAVMPVRSETKNTVRCAGELTSPSIPA